MVDSSQVHKEHVHAASPAVGLLRVALNVDVGCISSEELGLSVYSREPLAESVVYLVGRMRRPEVEGIIVTVGVVVGDEGGEVAVVVYVEDRDGAV
jgi:hypothetical protein